MIPTEFEKEDNNFIYDLDEATAVALANLPDYMLSKFSYEDIHFILKLEMEFLINEGIMIDEDQELSICNYPVDFDQDAMENYVISNAIKSGIMLSFDEFDEIFEAELIYYQINGALSDAGEFYN